MNLNTLTPRSIPKNWRRWLLFFTLALIFGPYLYSRLKASDRIVRVFDASTTHSKSETIADEFSILIFNIAHGRGSEESNLSEGGFAKYERIRKIAEFLKGQNTDIVVLNEVDFCSTWSGHQNQAEEIAKIAGYRYRGEQRNLDLAFVYGSWQFGNAVLSKFPIQASQEFDYPDQSILETWLAGKKRGAMFTFNGSDTRTVNLIPIHLEHRSEDIRIQSVDRILAQADLTAPTILAGDFNSTPTDSPGASRSADGGNAMNRLLESGKFKLVSKINNEYQPTYPSNKPVKTIDWILVSPSVEILDYQVLRSELSDHLPVRARIRLLP